MLVPSKDKQRCFDIVSVVVTHNRKNLLLKCLGLLLDQSIGTDILVIDNASTDGTEQVLEIAGFLDNERIHYIHLNKNTGGAGGFHYGLKYAFEQGWNWFWLMDDDAEPHQDALEKLVEQSNDKNSIYGSVAVSNLEGKTKLCFPTKKINNKKVSFIENYELLGIKERVVWLPFLGFFIHRDVVQKIGYPDKDFFIRNDDVEYSERANKFGIKIYMIKWSVIDHPFQPTVSFILLGKKVYHRSMPAWKMHYEVRNKIIIAKRYYSVISGMKSISGVTLQVFLSILIGKNKKNYLKAFFQGIIDGIVTK
jgi:GT2 family glycosyltransferase